MSKKQDEHKKPLSIRDLYPHLSDEQLQEAEENLERYIALALRIYDRICSDPQEYAKFKALTASNVDHSMHAKRSDHPPNPNKP